jgi:hypothetical protein
MKSSTCIFSMLNRSFRTCPRFFPPSDVFHDFSLRIKETEIDVVQCHTICTAILSSFLPLSDSPSRRIPCKRVSRSVEKAKTSRYNSLQQKVGNFRKGGRKPKRLRKHKVTIIRNKYCSAIPDKQSSRSRIQYSELCSQFLKQKEV